MHWLTTVTALSIGFNITLVVALVNAFKLIDRLMQVDEESR